MPYHDISRLAPILILAVIVGGLAAPAQATVYSWRLPTSGSFDDPFNWDPSGGPPGSGDFTLFNLDAAYTVSFPFTMLQFNPPKQYFSDVLQVNQGNVSFVDVVGGQGPPRYTVNSLVIGPLAGINAQLNTSLADFNVTGSVAIGDNGGAGELNLGGGTMSIGGLNVGESGEGTLVIETGGFVSNTDGVIGGSTGSNGTVTVTGAGSTWTNSGDLLVGSGGHILAENNSSLNIGEPTGNLGGNTFDLAHDASVELITGSTLRTNFIRIGLDGTSQGAISVDGANTLIDAAAAIDVGFVGPGAMTISSGGRVESFFGSVGRASGGSGLVTISGTDESGNRSSWVVESKLNVGLDEGSDGELHVLAGAELSADELAVGGSGTGMLTIEAGGSVSNTSGFIGLFIGSIGTATIMGNGSHWAMSGRLSIGGDADMGINGGTGTLNIQPGGTVDVAEDTVLFPNGLVRLQGGTMATTDFDLQGGEFQWTSGTLHVGVYNGNLVNSGGTLAPGQSAGGTTIFGDYTQQTGATLEIEIGGTATATQHDFVDVNGAVLLGGSLELALIDDFLPSPDNEFIVFNADDLSGFFRNAGNGQRVDTTDGLGSFLVHYGPTSAFNPNQIVLTDFEPANAAGLPGDYNQNCVVDAADYTVWRDHLGQMFTLPNEDPNSTPGQVTAEDYDFWKTRFGQSTGNSAPATAVSEPACSVPLITIGLALFLHRAAASRSVERGCH